MNIEETGRLIAKVKMTDQYPRDFDAANIVAWAEILTEIPLADAFDALLTFHKSGQSGSVMPGHIIKLVAEEKERRRLVLHAAGPPDYPSDLTHAQEADYRRLYQGHVVQGMSRQEATAAADTEFGAQRLELVAAPADVRTAMDRFTARRAIS